MSTYKVHKQTVRAQTTKEVELQETDLLYWLKKVNWGIQASEM
jgi:hypothetical protein